MQPVVKVQEVAADDLQVVIQTEKDLGKRILALSPASILRGKVKTYTLVTQ
jgi:hypothetical protein